ncbi:MAG: class I SAM-dependent methyltransferase [Desulfomonilaceae bacterium]
MAKHVCPWWLGYLLACPIRRWFQNPEKILSPYINEGMTVLEIGPGMGFFTIPAARMVGAGGKVIVVDVQEKMLKALVKRAKKAGVADRIVPKLIEPDSIGVSEPIDLCLLFYVVHEVPDPASLFSQIKAILKPGGKVLIVEPVGWYVIEKGFQENLAKASAAGLKVIGKPQIRRSRSALLALE